MASSLKPDVVVTNGDLFSQISNASGTVPYNTSSPELGVRAVTGDGREFRYVQAGASALIIGQLQQGPAVSTTTVGTCPVQAAVAVGSSTSPSTTLSLTITSSTVAANFYAGGVMITYGTVANGGGQIFQIASNAAITSATTLSIVISDPIQTALTASASFILLPNKYQGVIQNPTTSTGAIAGVAVGALPASYYGWLQVKGLANVLIQGTPAINLGLTPSTSTAGALAVVAATTPQVAINLATGVNSQYGPVDLLIS